MRKALVSTFWLFVVVSICTAQSNEFKVRYNGGTTASKVKPDDWGNIMSVTSSDIFLKLKDGQEIHIDPKKVAGLSYGKNASRNIKGYAAAAILVNPLFLFGMLKKNKQHFIGITYETANAERGAVLVQAKNDRYRGLLDSLKGVTGKEVETDEKEKPK
jgi:hypothetical protein